MQMRVSGTSFRVHRAISKGRVLVQGRNPCLLQGSFPQERPSCTTLGNHRVRSLLSLPLIRTRLLTLLVTRASQAKIALKGSSEEQLAEFEAIAKSLNLCARAVHNKYGFVSLPVLATL